MLQIISQLAITCKDQKVTEDWYCRNFGFRRARVAKLPDGKEIIFIKMADSSFYLELFAADGDSPLPDAENDGYTFPGFSDCISWTSIQIVKPQEDAAVDRINSTSNKWVTSQKSSKGQPTPSIGSMNFHS